ncbi:unnamed protein product [Somion occarium]|uniref:Secreted protein n=1 Tax=Somion occarium TaxID=3059160 RepID=A0ABP1E218_9APHY
MCVKPALRIYWAMAVSTIAMHFSRSPGTNYTDDHGRKLLMGVSERIRTNNVHQCPHLSRIPLQRKGSARPSMFPIEQNAAMDELHFSLSYLYALGVLIYGA